MGFLSLQRKDENENERKKQKVDLKNRRADISPLWKVRKEEGRDGEGGKFKS